MTKEQIAKQLAKKIYQMPAFTKNELEFIILAELAEILHADKGRLTEGTLK